MDLDYPHYHSSTIHGKIVGYSVEGAPEKLEIHPTNINVFPLPDGEGFWDNNPIVHNKKVFALQNILARD